MLIDIVIPYRIPPHGTHELQFALRSACEHYDVGRVILLGDKPDWCVGVEHVPGGDGTRDPIANVAAKLRRLLSREDCPGNLVLWNDDMYVLQRGVSLEPTSDSGNTVGSLAQKLIGRYKAAAENTANNLVSSACPSSELHKPMRFLSKPMASVLHASYAPFLFRSVYVFRMGQRTWDSEPDRLALKPDDVAELMQGPWFASRDLMACDDSFLRPMRARFPVKCRFEV